MNAVRRGAIAGLVTLAGCATVHGNMTTSAGNLAACATAFALEAGQQLPEAAEFAGEAHDFVGTLDRAGDRKVILTYQRLWDAYHDLRDEVARSASLQARIDFKPVTRAFAEVALDARGYADADDALYARGGFQHDPYYDP